MTYLKTQSLVLLALITLLSACGVLREPAAASGPIAAVPLEVAGATEAADLTSTSNESETAAAETADPADPTTEPMEAVPEASMEEAAPEEMTAEPTEKAAAPAAGDVTVFEISQNSSQVRFELDEDLRGNRLTVVGMTDKVAGQIAVNYADLSTMQVGEIRINARALATDNNFRNRAIQNEILDTGSYEFITFTPTAVNDLPHSVAIGDSVQFTLVGDLTIRDISSEVTFAVQATAVSETEFSGTATALVTRETYGLQIPSVPNVANVEEEVELYIAFTANAA